MLKKRNVMVDIETLGTEAGTAIISIGACEFSAYDPGTPNEFYVNINLLDSLFSGFTINAETLKWWMSQNKQALRRLVDSPAPRSLRDALVEFSNYLGPRNDDYYIWAKGPDFDLVLLDAAYKKLGWPRAPWSYRNARDVRTILWAADVVQPAATTEHDALADAIAQAQGVADALLKLEGLNGKG